MWLDDDVNWFTGETSIEAGVVVVVRPIPPEVDDKEVEEVASIDDEEEAWLVESAITFWL